MCRPGQRWQLSVAMIALVLAGGVLAGPAVASAEPAPALEDLSPGFLGMYRKVMLIEDEIGRYADAYGVDRQLAWAVCLYESGGNAGLVSHAGAQGYYQVMPATFRELGVASNIEAGVKYLGQMIRRFGREDRAIAAYNGGPGLVGRNGGLPLETLQYVVGVGAYRSLLRLHEPSIRQQASRLRLESVREGDTWDTLSRRLGLGVWELRLHNPFLAGRRLRSGQRVAFPPEPRADLGTIAGPLTEYRMRHGDNYFNVAFSLDVDVEGLRTANGLWQIQVVPPGTVLRIPADARRAPSAAPATTTVSASAPTAPVRHRVLPGDTLSHIAARYGTTVSALQTANRLGRRTVIRTGQLLVIPAS